MRPLALVFIALTLATADGAVGQSSSSTTNCVLTECPMILKRTLGGSRILQRPDGIIWPRRGTRRPKLYEVVAASPRAVEFAESYERRVLTRKLIGVGLLTSILTTLLTRHDEVGLRRSAFIGTLGFGIATASISQRADHQLQRAVEAYNADIGEQ